MSTYAAKGEPSKFLKTNSALLVVSVILATGWQVACGGGAGGINMPPASVVSIAPGSLAFGNQTVNTPSAPQTVTLTNAPNAALSITGITVTGSNADDFGQSNACGSSVPAGAYCTIGVTFTPSARGSRTALLSISDSFSGSPQTVPLSGTGTHGVVLSWTASMTPGVVGYYVYRSEISGGPYPTQLNSSPISGTTYTDETVEAGQTYYYVVTAVASNGITHSAASLPASATVPSP